MNKSTITDVVRVDVQNATEESDLPDQEMLTHWVTAALQCHKSQPVRGTTEPGVRNTVLKRDQTENPEGQPSFFNQLRFYLLERPKRWLATPNLLHYSPFTCPSETSDLELTIRIVDEVEAQQLNETWRQRTGPTNVLSFPYECPECIENLGLLGDIVICAPLVAREAAEQQKSGHAHWAHLVIHGTLHLLGYDHTDDSQAQAMENLEIRILHNLGYPNPYHTDI